MASFYGTSGDDNITGGWDPDVIWGYGGTDIIYGGWFWGGDTIYGGDGNDEIYGEGGDDWLYGDLGNDVIKRFGNTEVDCVDLSIRPRK